MSAPVNQCSRATEAALQLETALQHMHAERQADEPDPEEARYRALMPSAEPMPADELEREQRQTVGLGAWLLLVAILVVLGLALGSLVWAWLASGL